MFNLSDNDYKIIKEFITKNKIKIAAIQAPEGLKTKIQSIEKRIRSENNITTAIFLEPCYGACDIPDLNLKELGFDGIIHIGHSKYLKNTKLPVIYIELQCTEDLTPTLLTEINKLKKYKNIGIITTIQHIDQLKKIEDTLNKNNIKTYRGKPKIATYPCQILGCDQSAALDIKNKVEAYLYIGTGKFHPLGVARATGKPVILLNPEKKEIKEIDKTEAEKYERIIIIKISKFKDAGKIGLLVTTKKGQANKNYAEIAKKLKAMKKEVYILVLNHISPEKIEGLELDFLVNTACPRIEEDNIYKIPLLNWETITNKNS